MEEKMINQDSGRKSRYYGLLLAAMCNKETNTHSKNVEGLLEKCFDIIEKCIDPNYFTSREKEEYLLGARLHDIGKSEPEVRKMIEQEKRFTREEILYVRKRHSEMGGVIQYGMRTSWMCQLIAEAHHIPYDLIPDEYQGNEVTPKHKLMINLVSILDKYEAMITRRCYKNPMGFEETLQQIAKEAQEYEGQMYTTEVLVVFLLTACQDKTEECYNKVIGEFIGLLVENKQNDNHQRVDELIYQNKCCISGDTQSYKKYDDFLRRTDRQLNLFIEERGMSSKAETLHEITEKADLAYDVGHASRRNYSGMDLSQILDAHSLSSKDPQDIQPCIDTSNMSLEELLNGLGQKHPQDTPSRIDTRNMSFEELLDQVHAKPKAREDGGNIPAPPCTTRFELEMVEESESVSVEAGLALLREGFDNLDQQGDELQALMDSLETVKLGKG